MVTARTVFWGIRLMMLLYLFFLANSHSFLVLLVRIVSVFSTRSRIRIMNPYLMDEIVALITVSLCLNG